MLSLLQRYKLGILLESIGFLAIFLAGIAAIKDELGIAEAAILGAIVALFGRKLSGSGKDLIELARDEAHSLANRLTSASVKGGDFLKDEARSVAASIKAAIR